MVKPLLDVTETSFGLEYSIHACPRRHREEIAVVFPSVAYEQLLIIPTCQHATIDLVNVSEAVDAEKDALLERFFAFARAACDALAAQGHWADYIDPCSGLPMVHKEGAGVYSEVDALVTLLGYPTANAGCCKVVLHPRWGSAVYPASLLTQAPLEAAAAALAHAAAVVAAKSGAA